MMATILDYLVGSFLKKLEDIITEKAILVLGLKKEFIELQRTISYLGSFLNDAENRRTEGLANKWLGDLRDALYDAEDIVDLARFEGSKLLSARPSLASSSSINSTGCNGFFIFSCFPNIPRRHEIAVRIKNFNAELEKILKLGESFLKSETNIQPRIQAKPKKTGYILGKNIVGNPIVNACKRGVELVLEHKDEKEFKIGIIGIGGVGKTTLAQKIYNNEKIEEKFSNKIWICISQDYSEVDLLKEVLRNLGVHQEQGESIAEHTGKIAATAQGRSLFLVLDDVWDHRVWTDLLQTPLSAAASVTLLVTTRHETVARAISVEYTHRVELMTVEVGWELLWRSMNINEEKEVEKLRDLGMEIVRKSGCLPLAIKVVAGILATEERNENQWRKFIEKNAWSKGQLPTELRGALYLSYDELPGYLKQCFLHCGLYPEDWIMSRNDLIRLWIAQGFVEDQEKQLLEEIAEDYYYELIQRNLLQPDQTLSVEPIWCRMHDLLRQLARHVSGDEIFCGEPQSLEVNSMSKVRRLSIITEKDAVDIPDVDNEKIRIRTLIICFAKSLRFEHSIFKRLPCIRVLDLTGSRIQSIPDCIGHLIHLRLLDFDGTNITFLPESIGYLVNLQILNLQRCKSLHRLPLAITRLCNLRRLGLHDTPINEVPKGLKRLEFLNDLEGFPIGGGTSNAKIQDGWSLDELVPLSKLWRLHMVSVERAVSCSSSTDSLLIEKHLKELHSCCTIQTDKAYSEEDVSNIEKVFEQLAPPSCLEKLSFDGFFGRRYPTWLDTINLSSLQFVTFLECKSLANLPPFGRLPSLKSLEIRGAASVTNIGPEFAGWGVGDLRSTETVAFPKLECLKFMDMPNWEEWSFFEEEGQLSTMEIELWPCLKIKFLSLRFLPCLKELSLVRCPRLRALPRELGQEAASLKKLLIRGANSIKTVQDFPSISELTIDGCQDLERISGVPRAARLDVHDSPNLRFVDNLGSICFLCIDGIDGIPPPWATRLQKQHCQNTGHESKINLRIN